MENKIILILSTYKLNAKCVELLQGWELNNGDLNHADLPRIDVALVWPNLVEDLIQKGMQNLATIQTLSAGVDDLPYSMIPSNVKIFSNAGGYSQSVSEHAMAMLLALSKNVNRRDHLESYGIARKTLVILGGGGIGSKVAQIAKVGFHCKIIGVSRSFKNPEQFDEKLETKDLDYAIEYADFLVCALPLNKFTKNLLNDQTLRKAKKRLVIANVGRAEAINEEDMCSLLIKNPEIRFGTDVFWRAGYKENFDSKLWSLPNFMGTLHTAGAAASQEVRDLAAEAAVRNLRSFLSTGLAQNAVIRSDYV
ncbi:MAG: 3-phosphoglycerate dehydrogenase [Thaumarchaeota archaeon]|nr:3-phosphoglycerate dehydrogenase [Nitrososphaerota archaeon]